MLIPLANLIYFFENTDGVIRGCIRKQEVKVLGHFLQLSFLSSFFHLFCPSGLVDIIVIVVEDGGLGHEMIDWLGIFRISCSACPRQA